jgi:hypothetical protein
LRRLRHRGQTALIPAMETRSCSNADPPTSRA